MIQAQDFVRQIIHSVKKVLEVGDVVEGKVLQKRPRELFIDLGVFGVGRVYGREYLQGKDIAKHLKVGDAVNVKTIGLDDGYGNYEVSIREAGEINRWLRLKEAREKGLISSIKVVEANRGGLLMEMEGIRGFLPVSQLAAGHYPRVEGSDKNLIFQELKKFVGQMLNVRILDVDIKSGKFILSERAAEEGRVHEALRQFRVGQVVEAEVVGLSKFGVFLRLSDDPPIEGLAHITEIPHAPVELHQRYRLGERVNARIIRIDRDRVNFSLKDAQAEGSYEAFLRTLKVGEPVVGRLLSKEDVVGVVALDQGVKGLLFEGLDRLVVGEEVPCVVQELEPKERKLVLKVADSPTERFDLSGADVLPAVEVAEKVDSN